MRITLRNKLATTAALVLAWAALAPAEPLTKSKETSLAQWVRHELIMLPYYSVFDNLLFQVDGAEITLMGQVTRPTLKSDAEHVLRKLEGVQTVRNLIEVLPLSPFDDRIRLAVYRAVYGHTAMLQHAVQPLAPIRIIVKHGEVTLEGTVGSEMARNIAFLQANGVPGVFSVTNKLRVNPA